MVKLIVKSRVPDFRFLADISLSRSVSETVEAVKAIFGEILDFRGFVNGVMEFLRSAPFHKASTSESLPDPDKNYIEMGTLNSAASPEVCFEGSQLLPACEAAWSLISAGKPINEQDVRTYRERISTALRSAYPGYDFSPVCELKRAQSHETLDDAVLWWITHKLQKGDSRSLGQALGVNDRSVLNVTLMSAKEGPPVREVVVDSGTHQNMLSYYHKRQEELNKLDEDDDDSYLCSEWTDPKELKRRLIGCSESVEWRF